VDVCLESVDGCSVLSASSAGTTHLSHRVGGLGYGAPSLSCLRKRKSTCQSVCYKLFQSQRSMPQYLHARHESGEVGAWTGAQQAKRKTENKQRETLEGSLPPLPLSHPGCPQLLHAAGWIRTHGQASPSSETDGSGPRLPSPKPWRLEGIHASWVVQEVALRNQNGDLP
jgi:hypothetical protein